MAIQYYGKYRAKVVDVQDPEKRGRIRVMCPKVLGEAKSSWCEPCIPVAYDLGGDFAIPKVDEFVWVEFEEGNPNKPIYCGGLWSKEKSPSPSYETEDRLITWGDCEMKVSKDNVITISIKKRKLMEFKYDKVTITVDDSTFVIEEDNIKATSTRIDLN